MSTATQQAGRAAVRARRGGPLEGIGDFVEFAAKVMREVPVAVRLYPAEIVRHAALLFRENALVVLGMLFVMGAVLGLTTTFLLESIGIDSYIAAVSAIGGMRGIIQVVFGWVVAAKVGCGIVAELGAMRISEEIDAMEVMGVRSVPYLVSTRIVAGAIIMPLLFVTAMSVNFLAAFLFNVELLGTVSSGGFNYVLYLFQNLRDFALATIWGTTVGVTILLVSSYFGYHASGGPVGVGRSTAQSMLVNLVLVSIVGMCLVQLFYGNSPNAPIGN